MISTTGCRESGEPAETVELAVRSKFHVEVVTACGAAFWLGRAVTDYPTCPKAHR